MNTPHAYLVDFDGTLADTKEANYLAYAHALLEVGIDISRKEFDRVAFGRNWRQFLPVLLRAKGKDAVPAYIAARKVLHYKKTVQHVRFNEALILVLKSRSSEIKVALVTSASAANVNAALSNREDIKHIFDVVITGDDVTSHKPNPEAFQMAAEQLGVGREHCVVFEDSDIGMEAARAFGALALRIYIE